jgi:murein tripeptide amidase MpaA
MAISVLVLGLVVPAAHASEYPPRDSGYHSYAEMVAHIRSVEAAHPDIVRVFSIGKSQQGRKIWAAEVSDRVGIDEGEPEVLFDGLHHAREHLGVEQTLYVLDLLTGKYGKSGSVGRRVTKLVGKRRIWIVFMLNPDGLAYDLGGNPYREWRKNRQPTPGSSSIGTDLNRNYGYRFGCCGGSSGKPSSAFYRGPKAWSAPETRALRDFVDSRVIDGRQRIRAHITFHTAGELVLWPYGYTRADVPSDMTRLDQRALKKMAKAMALANGYRAKQSSGLYRTDGDMIDWMYGKHRVFSYTFELYPRNGSGVAQHYPRDEIIGRETKRNRDAVLYLIGRAACPYAALGAWYRHAYCGPLFDDLEVKRGWRVDPDGADTATDGGWVRAKPLKSGKQLGSTASGRYVLITGRREDRDVDGGVTTARSAPFMLPTQGTAKLHLAYWVALGKSADASDGLRVFIVDDAGVRKATLLAISGDGEQRDPRWQTLHRRLPAALAGTSVAIELEAIDAGDDTLVEAAVDQVRVTID